jgi:hypothetical protein
MNTQKPNLNKYFPIFLSHLFTKKFKPPRVIGVRMGLGLVELGVKKELGLKRVFVFGREKNNLL